MSEGLDQPLLDISDLQVSFGASGSRIGVVKGISFSIGSGETLALVGESGSGKSVSSMAIMGLIGKGSKSEQVSGSIRFKRQSDTEATELTALSNQEMRHIRGAEIAMIFQEPMTSLNPVLRVGTQITETLIEHQNMSKAQARTTAEELLTRVSISDAARRMRNYPHELSGGMRQRVMIAMALSCQPSLLIADEPTTALDVTIQAQILDLIRDLKDEYGASVLFITHDLGVVREVADRIMVMYAGRIVEEGPMDDVLSNPQHPYTKGLIACVPRLEKDWDNRQELRPIPGMVADPANPPDGCAFHPRCAHHLVGACDRQVPEIERLSADRAVACLRWRALNRELVQ